MSGETEVTSSTTQQEDEEGTLRENAANEAGPEAQQLLEKKKKV